MEMGRELMENARTHLCWVTTAVRKRRKRSANSRVPWCRSRCTSLITWWSAVSAAAQASSMQQGWTQTATVQVGLRHVQHLRALKTRFVTTTPSNATKSVRLQDLSFQSVSQHYQIPCQWNSARQWLSAIRETSTPKLRQALQLTAVHAQTLKRKSTKRLTSQSCKNSRLARRTKCLESLSTRSTEKREAAGRRTNGRSRKKTSSTQFSQPSQMWARRPPTTYLRVQLLWSPGADPTLDGASAVRRLGLPGSQSMTTFSHANLTPAWSPTRWSQHKNYAMLLASS